MTSAAETVVAYVDTSVKIAADAGDSAWSIVASTITRLSNCVSRSLSGFFGLFLKFAGKRRSKRAKRRKKKGVTSNRKRPSNYRRKQLIAKHQIRNRVVNKARRARGRPVYPLHRQFSDQPLCQIKKMKRLSKLSAPRRRTYRDVARSALEEATFEHAIQKAIHRNAINSIGNGDVFCGECATDKKRAANQSRSRKLKHRQKKCAEAWIRHHKHHHVLYPPRIVRESE